MLAFGHERAQKKLRVRIVVELVLHSDSCLDKDYLQRGINQADEAMLPLTRRVCMYTILFAYIIDVTEDGVLKSFETETLGITGSYMGIIEVFVMASVLDARVNSVYPKKGPNAIRDDLHRVVLPRVRKSYKEVSFMWTSTRYNEMTNDHVAPSHFGH